MVFRISNFYRARRRLFKLFSSSDGTYTGRLLRYNNESLNDKEHYRISLRYIEKVLILIIGNIVRKIENARNFSIYKSQSLAYSANQIIKSFEKLGCCNQTAPLSVEPIGFEVRTAPTTNCQTPNSTINH